MRAFLSHSSKDKGFVESVAELLRPGTYEIDSQTFDSGILNSEAILNALRQSDLFCLFLSRNSVTSAYVNFEQLLGIEFFASGKIGRFLTICLDDEAFNQASESVKYFNVVRKRLDAESTARLIQGALISAARLNTSQVHPFIGRETELLELEQQVTDHKRPLTRALFLSGNFGTGRRSISHRFFELHYPHVARIFPQIDVEQFSGLDELHRRILSTLRPTITVAELRTRIAAYERASTPEKQRMIAQLLNSLLTADETAILFDKGGVLTAAGQLTPELNEIFSHLDASPHPPVIAISPRMIPPKLRRKQNDISYLAVKSLKRNSTKTLILKLLKDRSISTDDESLQILIKLCDGHPLNIYRMIEEIVETSLSLFIANPTNFIEWKHRQSSEYVRQIEFDETEVSILSLLKMLPELDFPAIITAIEVDASDASESLVRLINRHVVESSAERFSISPALRIAVERDKRINLPRKSQLAAARTLARTLSIRLEEGTAPITLVDAAVLSALESGDSIPTLSAAFLLPSHHVWMAKRHYDQRNWKESIRFASEALKGSGRLSYDGRIAACRYLCLAGAREGEGEAFDQGMKRLESDARDDWAKSNIAFLNGFHQRLRGNLPKAEDLFRQAYDLSPGNQSTAREIASICLARGNLDDAEHFAREAYRYAQNNPFLIDILLAVLIRRHGQSAKHMPEINEMFDILAKVAEESGRSFFTTRKAEFEHLWGNNREGLRLIEQAIDKTPTLFEPRRLHAKILLKDGNKLKAYECINTMKAMVSAGDPNERRSSYRLYLETYAHYLTEVGRFGEAKEVFDDVTAFTPDERDAAVRDIEIVQGYRLQH